MSKLSHIEIESIREVVLAHQLMASKLSFYANSCQDIRIKDMFKSAASDAERNVQSLLEMLG